MRWKPSRKFWLSLIAALAIGRTAAQDSLPTSRYHQQPFFFFSIGPAYYRTAGHIRKFADGLTAFALRFHYRTPGAWTIGARFSIGMTERIRHNPFLTIATDDTFLYNALGLKEPMNIRFQHYAAALELSRFFPIRRTLRGTWYWRPRLAGGYALYHYWFEHPGLVPLLQKPFRRGFDYMHGGADVYQSIGIGWLSEDNRLHIELSMEAHQMYSVFLRKKAYDQPAPFPHTEWDFLWGPSLVMLVLISPP